MEAEKNVKKSASCKLWKPDLLVVCVSVCVCGLSKCDTVSVCKSDRVFEKVLQKKLSTSSMACGLLLKLIEPIFTLVSLRSRN